MIGISLCGSDYDLWEWAQNVCINYDKMTEFVKDKGDPNSHRDYPDLNFCTESIKAIAQMMGEHCKSWQR